MFLPSGWHVCNVERAHASGFSYHLAAYLQRSAGARERVFLPFGWHVCGAYQIIIGQACVQRWDDARGRVC